MTGVASALAFVHSHGFIHSDIRPCNILYDIKFRAVLCDFSLTLPRKPRPPRLRSEGAPWYLPPEFLISDRLRDQPSDIWALGVELQAEPFIVKDVFPTEEEPTAASRAAREGMEKWLDCVRRARDDLPIRIGDTDMLYPLQPVRLLARQRWKRA